MHRIRKLTLLAAPALLLIVAACGAPSATATPDDGNGGGGTEATATPTEDGGGGGGGTGDLDEVLNQLTPPNSSETGRFNVEGGLSVSYTSTSSIDDLTTFYDQKLDDLGAEVFSSSDAGGGHAWVFSVGEVTGGSVSVVESEGATALVITLGSQ